MSKALFVAILYCIVSPIAFTITFPGGAGHEGAVLVIGVAFVSLLSGIVGLLVAFTASKLLQSENTIRNQSITVVSILLSSYLLFQLMFSDGYFKFRRTFYISNAISVAFPYALSIVRNRLRKNKQKY